MFRREFIANDSPSHDFLFIFLITGAESGSSHSQTGGESTSEFGSILNNSQPVTDVVLIVDGIFINMR